MIEETVYVRASLRQVADALRRVPHLARGAAGRGLMLRVGLAALGRVRRAFVAKARGGADETGLSWKPLSPRTVAYSRKHPGMPRKRPGTRPSWALTAAQRARWKGLFARYVRVFRGDAAHAAAVAWAVLKKEGAKTVLGRYGSAKAEILRDTGLLLNSLSPGVVAGRAAPTSPGTKPRQVFRLGPGQVIIGTKRKGAVYHHRGTSRLPKRPLWPAPRDWTAGWWADIQAQAVMGLLDIATAQLRKL